MAGMTPADVGVFECHDCFSITGLLCLEAAGFASPGEAPGMILDGHVRRTGRLPVNTTGGLIGFGHYVGGTGVRQAVDLLRQITGSAGESQVHIDEARPIGLLLNMGGDDKTAVALVVQRAR
jgi:acetyl-CoA C-acetyltransferase/acetyl-CoA acyltransferase